MSDPSLKGLRVAMAGAGVLGLTTAALAVRRGAEVVVFDPAARGANASGVAAGMLSPALEAALEGVDAAGHALFQRAYAAWADFAMELGLPLAERATGAIRVGDAVHLDALASRLRDLGADPRGLDSAEVRARQPLYGGGDPGLLVSDDTRLDPVSALDALARCLASAGGQLVARGLTPGAPLVGFDRLVIATGYDAHAFAGTAPELAHLGPIKGHILHYALAGRGGPTLRGEGGYLAPQAGHVAFGATMEAGRADAALDPEISAELHAQAVALAPALAEASRVARTGVRAATPDGLPLVGRSAGGAILAVGARRNGWLLAPLVAQAAVEALAGGAPWAEFDPARFGAA